MTDSDAMRELIEHSVLNMEQAVMFNQEYSSLE